MSKRMNRLLAPVREGAEPPVMAATPLEAPDDETKSPDVTAEPDLAEQVSEVTQRDDSAPHDPPDGLREVEGQIVALPQTKDERMASMLHGIEIEREIAGQITKIVGAISPDALRSASQKIVSARNGFDKARDGLVEAGDALRALRSMVGEGNMAKLVRSGVIGIPDSYVSKLITISATVADGAIARDKVPHGFVTAYRVCADPALAKALEHELPNVTQAQVEEASRKLRSPDASNDMLTLVSTRLRLIGQQRAAQKRLQRIQEELTRLGREIASVDSLLMEQTNPAAHQVSRETAAD